MSNEELDIKLFWEFYYWSEFHAKKRGCGIYYIWKWHKITGRESPKNGKYPFSKIDFQITSLNEKLEEVIRLKKLGQLTNSGAFYNFFEELMSFLGRLSLSYRSLNDFPDFQHDFFKKYFGNSTEKIFVLLQSMHNYDKAKKFASKFRIERLVLINHLNSIR